MKPQQLESQLLRVLSDAIGELSDPRIPMIVTVEAVSLTPDFVQARVYISSMGDMEGLLDALHNARGHLQRQVAHAVKMRRTPLLEFFAADDRKW
ncbi:30S ribosome-binding factor RbfA [Deinococcus psychrotolerans]|uniref:Ribosome-binding factor A n=1 Tax=Deinococcus psychrotolerans TaxID=2489213 RepID=A0A3G8YQT7_9DEIO|nr:30S ribosome-binding factor RbfA [Deinococcus psychrotolerans]AZI43576.1 30S ribosome-binding factor RbfA [Deinococcus psychrotolerans]